jgi:hypothetical protein
MTKDNQLAILGPHQAIAAETERERFTLALFDRLWEQYRQRVSYVQIYEQVVAVAGATFVNDHIAFRTIANQSPQTGIASLSRIFEALDYRPAGVYHFPDKHLNAIHYQHAHPEFPKLFISELKVWELNGQAKQLLSAALSSHREPIPLSLLAELSSFDQQTDSAAKLHQLAEYFQRLPWQVPDQEAVQALSAESQYAAWVLVHGYNVNHFTSLVNSHGVDSLNDLDKTIAALAAAGVPMKKEIEGEPGSKLRQSATEAVTIDVDVSTQGRPATMPWTYAYFELAERNLVTDPATGQPTRFEGFLGSQATNLFEMTRLRQ